jgi:spore coat protein H
MRSPNCLLVVLVLSFSFQAHAKDKHVADELFSGPVPDLKIEIPEAGMEILRRYNQVWRQTRPERIDVKATVREGQHVYTNVAIHLKGSYSFQGIDAKPSMTLHFDKFHPGQTFHGLTKIHLNNSVQDPTGLSEQFGREVFKELGIVAPRAGPALLHLNDRDMGLCVIVEGINKQFFQRNYHSAKGNVYDGGAGGDITKDPSVISGANPQDRADIKELIDATAEPDPARRLERMKKILDVDEFITFAAVEASIVHWDGYSIGCNNYEVFHDVARGKLIFLPHGMDQLYGVSNSPAMSLTPIFRGVVAKALFTIPEARTQYLKRIEELSNKELSVEALHAHIDRLAKRLRGALTENQAIELDANVGDMKSRMAQRVQNIQQQLKTLPRPVRLAKDGVLALKSWRFKHDSSYTARGGHTTDGQRELLTVVGGGATAAGGTWRSNLFLDEGHYEFTARVRTQGLANAQGIRGVMLRISGETKTDGFETPADWKTLTYSFDVRGLEQVEFVCEFRGPEGSCEIDAGTLRLTRKGPASKEAAKIEVPAPPQERIRRL